jgi:hypothetical protein
MKKLFWTSLIVLGFTTSVYASETKKVCHDETKNGKTTKVCKQIKVHKKLETETKPAK